VVKIGYMTALRRDHGVKTSAGGAVVEKTLQVSETCTHFQSGIISENDPQTAQSTAIWALRFLVFFEAPPRPQKPCGRIDTTHLSPSNAYPQRHLATQYRPVNTPGRFFEKLPGQRFKLLG
jgi:hypothetical protein